MFETILWEVKNATGYITLNRPEVYNALNDLMRKELLAAFREAGKNSAVRVVVITGSGKAFCSGQDLKEIMANPNRNISDSLRSGYNPLISQMRNIPKPVICRLNGIAAGAGCSLALASDIVIASEEAALSEIFVSIGLVLDSGSAYFLPRLVGSAKAFELATTGRKVPAGEAAAMGLINKAVPAEKLDDAVAEMLAYYEQAPTKAIALMKKMLNKSFQSDLDQMLDYEASCQEAAAATADSREGISAFLQKRSPQFKGE